MAKKKKALVLVPFAMDEQGVNNRRQQLTTVSLGPDIDFDFKPVTAGPEMYMSPHDFVMMDMAIFEAGLSAQDDGYDAVCIDTMSDSGLDALRAWLDIPVVGPGKLSMTFAMNLGNKFALLAQWEPSVIRNQKMVKSLGLEAFCAAIENYDAPPDYKNLLTGKEDTALPKMKAACERAIEKGADVICLGSTTMYQAADYLNRELPVPVINPGALTYKTVETLLAMGISHSRRPYPKPLKPHPNMIHAMKTAAAEKAGT
jgi:allantoin racemase